MNKELIARIDAWNRNQCDWTQILLSDCKAEIERLLVANETLKGLCEDYQAQIKVQGDEVGCDEIARPAPSFDAQREDLLLSYINECTRLNVKIVRLESLLTTKGKVNLALSERVSELEANKEVLDSECRLLESGLAKAKEYVPMTDDELALLFQEFLCADVMDSLYPKTKYVEAEVIKRAGLIVKERENG